MSEKGSPDLDSSEPFLRRSADRSSLADNSPTWSWLLIVTAVGAALGTVIPAGYNIGILNNPQQIIQNFCNESLWHQYGFVIEEVPLQWLWSFVVSIFLLGAGIGAFAAGPLANAFGRKKALLVINLLNVIASILFGFCGMAKSVEMLMLGRFIVGLGAGASSSFLPLYISEITTVGAQNILGFFSPAGINLGLLIGQILSLERILGNELGWNILLALTSVPALICISLLHLMPESPQFLLHNRKRRDLALKELCRLRGTNVDGVKAEMVALSGGEALLSSSGDSPDSESRKEMENWNLKNIFTTESIRWRVICVIVMHVGNQMSGINAVMYYSNDIFVKAGLDKTQAEFATLGAGLTNLVMVIATGYLVGKFARRTLMLTSSAGVGTLLIAMAITITNISEEVPWVAYTSMAALLVYVVLFNVGVGPLPYFLPIELIPPGPRPLVMSFGCTTNWSFNFLIALTFPSIQSVMNAYTFLIFAVATYAQGVFLYFKQPETFQPTPKPTR